MSEAAAVLTGPDKRPQVETLLNDVFRLMDYPAKLDFKDMPDGSLGVSVHFEGGELPGITAGKRSYLIDSVQFWLNKVVNRPNVPRRWVNLAVDSFPEPRMPGQPREPREPKEPAAPMAAPVAAPVAPQKRAEAPRRPERPERGEKKPEAPRSTTTPAPPPPARGRGREIDERTLTPAADPALLAAGTLLAEKSAKHGRVYGVMLLTPEARAQMLKAADEVKGVTGKAEGEGHWRRLVMVPEKLAVIAKKQVMPDYDDEEDE
ncbi:MAG: hypothetical protein Q8N23_18600 [Archangium sp.]|nr:hypothetical protein [Archangium sp.]MDP3154696.1 hypothetical protein [Archangium sp.]MDP3573586.1 hypothetical protein [Archangium sp.]